MAANIGYATLSIIPSAKGFASKLTGDSEFGKPLEDAGRDAGDKSGRSFGSSFKSGMKTAAKVGAAAFAGALGAAAVFGKGAVDAASNLDESMSKVNVVFGDASGAVVDWSKSSAKAMGQSQAQALEAAGTYGNLFKAFGLSDDATKDMSQSLVGLAADLASFNNTSIEDALAALQSGVSGETEPLKKFGVAISDVRLKQEAMALGLIKSTSEALTPAAKAQASYSLIMKDTALAQGDFGRTSDGLANKQRIMAAQFDDVKAKIGGALLPAMSAVVGFIMDKVIPAVAAIAEEWMPKLQAAFEVVSGWVQEHWPQIQAVITSVMTTIGDVIGTVVEAIQIIWANFGTQITAVVEAVWTYIGSYIEAAINIIKGVIDVVMGILSGDWGRVWDGIKGIVTGIWDQIKAVITLAIETVKQILSVAWDIIRSAAASVWGGIKTAVSDAWTGIKDLVGRGVNGVVDIITGIPERLVNLAKSMLDKGKAIGGAFLEGIKNSLSSLAGFAGDIAGSIVDAVKGAWNAVAKLINDFVPNSIGFGPVSIDLPDNPIPTFHTGGVVPGSAGQEVSILARAGERVLTEGQYAELTNRGGGVAAFPESVTLIVEGEPITARIKQNNRELAGQLAAGRR